MTDFFIFEDPIWESQITFPEQRERVSKETENYDQMSNLISFEQISLDMVAKCVRGAMVYTNRLLQEFFNSIEDYISALKEKDETLKNIATHLS